jgi:SAM-dependent methyltransferase
LQGSVLELGCGHGGLLAALTDAGIEAIGIDPDETRVHAARAKGLAAVVARSEHLPLPDESCDFIVSAATLEHIEDIAGALAEAHRVLRPRGQFCAVWGPAWLTYNGPHLIKCLSVPWVHLLFSDATILCALKRQRDRWPPGYVDYKISDFASMGRLTRKKLRAASRAAAFTIIEESSRSQGQLKQGLARLPLLSELLAGELTVVLEKTA